MESGQENRHVALTVKLLYGSDNRILALQVEFRKSFKTPVYNKWIVGVS